MDKITSGTKEVLVDIGEGRGEGRDEKYGCVGFLFSEKEALLFKL